MPLPLTDKFLELLIRPLIAMKYTVIALRNTWIGTGEAALNKFRELKSACQAVGGCFTLLWHNSKFEKVTKRGLYLNVIKS